MIRQSTPASSRALLNSGAYSREKQSRINKKTYDIHSKMISKYGSPENLNRSFLNNFNSQPLYFKKKEAVLEVADVLGINYRHKKRPETDLLWIAVFVVLHYNQSIYVTQEQKNWKMHLHFFSKILESQRELRRSNDYVRHSGKARKVIRANSWIRFYEGGYVYFNFLDGRTSNEIPETDLALIKTYFNYAKII